jgi:soluble lytic murein transglycosylase-like protein
MSVETVTSRVSQIEAMIAAAQSGVITPSTSSSNFNSTLAQAQSATTPTATAASLGAGDNAYSDLIQASAAKYGLDANVLKGLIKQESGFNPNAGSPAGAQGLTQLMPATAASLGVTNVHDPAQAIDGGAHYLKMQLDRFGGDYTKALAAYNAGPGAVQRFGGVPPYAETRNYVTKVLGYADAFRQQQGGATQPAQAVTSTSTLPYSIT